ncbi:unnamed protein product, partial [Ixodes pacificus]
QVKSRWRRSSELETRDVTPPASAPVTASSKTPGRDTSSPPRAKVPPSTKGSPSRSLAYEDIEENLYRFERRKSKCKKEVRRMICDCSLTKDERDRG